MPPTTADPIKSVSYGEEERLKMKTGHGLRTEDCKTAGLLR